MDHVWAQAQLNGDVGIRQNARNGIIIIILTPCNDARQP